MANGWMGSSASGKVCCCEVKDKNNYCDEKENIESIVREVEWEVGL